MEEDFGPSRRSPLNARPPSPEISEPLQALRRFINDQTPNALHEKGPASTSELSSPSTQTRDPNVNMDKTSSPLGKDISASDPIKETREYTSEKQVSGDGRSGFSPFAFEPSPLAAMVGLKDMQRLTGYGGIVGLLFGLGVDPKQGLSTKPNQDSPNGTVEGNAFSATLEDRRRVYGENVVPSESACSFPRFLWLTLGDKSMILLFIAGITSLILGSVKSPHNSEASSIKWVEGTAIVIAVLILVIILSLGRWQIERHYRINSESKFKRIAHVFRDGVAKVLDIEDLVVGDIAYFQAGDIIPCDSVFLAGHDVKCDEFFASGNLNPVVKLPYNETSSLSDPDDVYTNCFLISGSKVVEGVGKYVIVAVGTKSFNGRLSMASQSFREETSLQQTIDNLVRRIINIVLFVSALFFIALMIPFFVRLGKGQPHRDSLENSSDFVKIVVITAAFVVVAVPRGLLSAVALSHVLASKYMRLAGLFVRNFRSCQILGNVSVICTDKTGVLTQGTMTVVAGTIGVHAKFVQNFNKNTSRTNARSDADGDKGFSIDQSEINSILSPQLISILNEAIAINSTAFEETDSAIGERKFIGSSTEIALLQFAKDLGWADFGVTRDAARIVHVISFSKEHMTMGVVVQLASGRYRLYVKGAAEILLLKCTKHISIKKRGDSQNTSVGFKRIKKSTEENIFRNIVFYTSQALRTLAICYREFDSWPPAGNKPQYDSVVEDLTLIAIIAIEDLLRSDTHKAIESCSRGGIAIKMCTGDNALTARSIASQCGIYTNGGIVMEGPVFRKLSRSEMVEIVPRLQVLARSSSEDKRMLVETLRSLNEVVSVTGDSSHDGPALNTAHVGFSTKIASTEVAKEASDIIITNNNFSAIVTAVIWGRWIQNALQKLLQFQISGIITATFVTFVSAPGFTQSKLVLSPVQILWVTLIVDIFATLALVSDTPTEKLLHQKPFKRTRPLISVDMLKMIIMQSIYQITILLVFRFLAPTFLFPNNREDKEKLTQTLVFNAFVFSQIANLVNCRRPDNKLNIFEGILRHRVFIVIILLEAALQVIIVFFGGPSFQTKRLPGREWAISIAIGLFSIPLGAIIRCVPNRPIEKVLELFGLPGYSQTLPTTNLETKIQKIFNNSARVKPGTSAETRGGRTRNRASSFNNGRSHRRSSSRANSNGGHSRASSIGNISRASSAMSIAPSIMAGAVASSRAYSGPQTYPIAWFFTIVYDFERQSQSYDLKCEY